MVALPSGGRRLVNCASVYVCRNHIKFVTICPPFLSDFENNGTVEWVRKNTFWNPILEYLLGFGSLICGSSITPKRHNYDLSANNSCSLRANLIFCVLSVFYQTIPTSKLRKSHFFDPSPPACKNLKFLTTGIN